MFSQNMTNFNHVGPGMVLQGIEDVKNVLPLVLKLKKHQLKVSKRRISKLMKRLSKSLMPMVLLLKKLQLSTQL